MNTNPQYSLYTVNAKTGKRADTPGATGDSQRALIRAGAAYIAWDLVDDEGNKVQSVRPRADR